MKLITFLFAVGYEIALARATGAGTGCAADNCLRAVTGTNGGTARQSSRRADCSSIMQTAVTPPTATIHETVTITPETAYKTTTCATVVCVTETTTIPAATDIICPEGLTKCGYLCVDIKRDKNNCGKCNNKCKKGNCINGFCPSCDVASTCKAKWCRSGCICAKAAEGNICSSGKGTCQTSKRCTKSIDCPWGFICDVDNCCGRGLCSPVKSCTNPGVPASRMFKARMRRFPGAAPDDLEDDVPLHS